MKIGKAISKCNDLNPNSISRADKVEWLSQLDGLIKSEIYDNYIRNEGEGEIEFDGYDPTHPGQTEDEQNDTELLVPFPYDDIYVNFLIAQVYLMLGENSKYNNYAAIFNDEKSTFENYYSRTHKSKGPNNITYF